MQKIDLLPLKWIIIHNIFSQIFLEIWESEINIIEKLWNPKKIINHDENSNIFYYYENNLQLEFSWKSLRAIQICYDLCNNIWLDNQNIFKLDCDSLITKLSTKYWWFKEDFRKTDYSNIKYSIWLWRPCTPEDIIDDFWENDYEKWVFFSSVLIWEKWYFID